MSLLVFLLSCVISVSVLLGCVSSLCLSSLSLVPPLVWSCFLCAFPLLFRRLSLSCLVSCLVLVYCFVCLLSVSYLFLYLYHAFLVSPVLFLSLVSRLVLCSVVPSLSSSRFVSRVSCLSVLVRVLLSLSLLSFLSFRLLLLLLCCCLLFCRVLLLPPRLSLSSCRFVLCLPVSPFLFRLLPFLSSCRVLPCLLVSFSVSCLVSPRWLSFLSSRSSSSVVVPVSFFRVFGVVFVSRCLCP